MIVETWEQARVRAAGAVLKPSGERLKRQEARRRHDDETRAQMEARLALCKACPNYNDDYDGKVIDPPCGLMNGLQNKRWTICRWRGWLRKAEAHPDPRCPWNGEV